MEDLLVGANEVSATIRLCEDIGRGETISATRGSGTFNGRFIRDVKHCGNCLRLIHALLRLELDKKLFLTLYVDGNFIAITYDELASKFLDKFSTKFEATDHFMVLHVFYTVYCHKGLLPLISHVSFRIYFVLTSHSSPD
ncbi:hypothetical protein V1477_011432 [Vespula maculifrons]|uniref:Uncharacterized protein n=1 Tax=Vespula maculifrons TaxID=7453 RepID=A0ABD2BZ64_VESMC